MQRTKFYLLLIIVVIQSAYIITLQRQILILEAQLIKFAEFAEQVNGFMKNTNSSITANTNSIESLIHIVTRLVK